MFGYWKTCLNKFCWQTFWTQVVLLTELGTSLIPHWLLILGTLSFLMKFSRSNRSAKFRFSGTNSASSLGTVGACDSWKLLTGSSKGRSTFHLAVSGKPLIVVGWCLVPPGKSKKILEEPMGSISPWPLSVWYVTLVSFLPYFVLSFSAPLSIPILLTSQWHYLSIVLLALHQLWLLSMLLQQLQQHWHVSELLFHQSSGTNTSSTITGPSLFTASYGAHSSLLS